MSDLSDQIAEAISADHRETLHRITTGYQQAHTLLWERGATPRPTGRRTGKPGSRPPGGTDKQLRACLVECARAISDATWHLDVYDLPTPPWRPTVHTDDRTDRTIVGLGMAWTEPVTYRSCASCGARWDGDATAHTRACTEPDETVKVGVADRWAPDPDDLTVTVPTPDELSRVCDRLLGNLALLATWDVNDEHVTSSLRAVRRAKYAMVRAGLWERPVPDTDDDRCANKPCRNYPRRGGRECGTCANWRSRHGGKARTINDDGVSNVA